MKNTKLVSSMVIMTVLAACSKKDSSEHFLDAQKYIANQQYNAAIIELRSAIKKDPDDYRFRLALGRALLQSGDVATAERELERALRYGANLEEIALNLMQTYYLNGNYQAAVSFLAEDVSPDQRTQELLKTFRALSEIELGDSPAALLHFEQLLISPFADIAAFANAHLKLAAQQTEHATTELSTITSTSELYAESTFLQGKIYLAQDNSPSAIEYLQRYVELTPSAHLARLLLAQAYVRNNQLEEAEPQLTGLLRLFPDQPMANYLQSIISFQRDDFNIAKQLSEKAIRQPQIRTRALLIAAFSSVQLGLESQALSHLTAIKDQLVQYPDAQRLYALLQLRAGETEQASQAILSLPEAEQNLQLIASTAFELVRKGATNSAEDFLSHYEQKFQHDAASLTTLGTIKLGIEHQREAGIRDLEQALLLDPSVNRTRLILAMTYLNQGEFDKAVELTQQWMKDPEMQVAAYNIQAYAQLLQHNFVEAMRLSEQALQAKPLNPFSSLIQAMVHVQNQDLNAASNQLMAMLEYHPEYLPGLEQYYAVAKANQNTTDAVNRIEKLFQENQQAYPVRLLTARVAHDQQDFERVLTLLNNIDPQKQAVPPLHYLVLIESLQKLGRLPAATQAAERWHRQQPQSLQAGYIYANALALNLEPELALNLINQLLTEYANEPLLISAQVKLLMQLKRFEQALAVINNLSVSLTMTPELQFFKGRLELIAGKPLLALQAFQNSYAKQPSHETAMFVAMSLANAHSDDRANNFIKRHIETHGSNKNLDTYYATLLLKIDEQESLRMYSLLLDKEPNNIIALNNYAWLLTANNEAEKAIPYIERAVGLAPNHPDIMDTYGKVLLRMQRPSEALEQFEKSLNVRPDHAEVMLNYAEALLKTEQKQKAQAILTRISSTEPKILERKNQLEQNFR